MTNNGSMTHRHATKSSGNGSLVAPLMDDAQLHSGSNAQEVAEVFHNSLIALFNMQIITFQAAFAFRSRNTDISENEPRINPHSPVHVATQAPSFDPLRRFRPRSLRSDFFFKDFAPETFHGIRVLSRVLDDDYIGKFDSFDRNFSPLSP